MKRLFAVTLFCALAACAGAKPVTVEGYYKGDALLWDRMFEGKPTLGQPAGTPVAGILPHHDIDLVMLGRYYRGLAVQPSVVVLLSPNHFEWGTRPLVLPADTTYQTTEGDLVPDAELVAKPAAGLGNRAAVTSEPWSIEHGIFTHAPFIKHFFPRAKFVPVLLQMGAPREDVQRFAELLNKVLPPDALVLGSVDFSHYQIAPVAHFHDLSTAAAIRNLDYDRLLTREVDSPESVYTVMRFSELRGAAGTQVALTSSGDFSRDPFSETTSHQYWTFVSGTPRPESRVTLVVGGRLSRQASWGVPGSWPWDRYHRDPPDVAALSLLAGKEARFLNGFDAYLFGLPPGWTDRPINGLRCAFYGWDENRPFDAQRNAIAAHPSDFMAVVREGKASFSEIQVRTLTALGVQLVVDRGYGPAVAPVAVGQGLWVRSLGDLTAAGGGTGAVLMLSWSPGGWETKSFDVVIRDGKPQPIHQFAGDP